jgi:uncharacterized protein (TIGR04141 family)
LGILKNISKLLDTPVISIFNKSLTPINSKTNKEQIGALEKGIITKIISYSKNEGSLDIDICYTNFEDFFMANTYVILIPEIVILPNQKKQTYEYDSLDSFVNYEIFRTIYNDIVNSKEYRDSEDKNLFLDNFYSLIEIKSYDSNGILKTTGKLIEYIQTEYSIPGHSYFLLDNTWYEIQNQFDSNLKEKYIKRLNEKIIDYDFIPLWPTGINEDNYNKLFDSKTNPFFLHRVKIENIEICDALFVKEGKLYIIHVKDDISATIRDLTSQAYISSRIIEDESKGTHHPNLGKLYDTAVRQKRIDGLTISKNNFIKLFQDNMHEYVLVIRTQRYTKEQIKNAEYESRIAKFSLYEYAAFMHSDDLRFSIIIR